MLLLLPVTYFRFVRRKERTNENVRVGFICVPVISQYRTEEDLFKKEEKKAKLLKETIPFYLNKFEQTVGENGGYTVGSTVSPFSPEFNIKIFTPRAKNFARRNAADANLCQAVDTKFLENLEPQLALE